MARQQIWKSKIPGLENSHAASLAVEFELTGGEIANVDRKYVLEKTIHNKQITIDDLKKLCLQEKPFTKGKLGGSVASVRRKSFYVNDGGPIKKCIVENQRFMILDCSGCD